MKKNTLAMLGITIFLGLFIAWVPAFAGITDPVSVDAASGNLATDVTPVVDISIKNKSITDTTASFDFSLKANRSVPLTLVFVYGKSVDELKFDTPGTNKFTIHATSTMRAGDISDTQFPPSLVHLTPGTTYYFQIKDTTNSVLYQRVSFTTTGTVPDPREYPASLDKLTLSLPDPVTTPMGNSPLGLYKATFSGTIKSSVNMRVGLDLYIGDTQGSLTKVFRSLLAPTSLVANQEKPFELTVSDLQPGTKYFFKVHESTKDFDITPHEFPFITGGTAPVPSGPYDPNAPGAGALIPNYTFPTNIGEPDGAGDDTTIKDNGEPLVPCGKKSDQQDEANKNCGFNHLIKLVANVFRFLLVMIFPLTVLACVYTGVQMILHRSMPAELEKYKDRLVKIVIGLAVMILAWVIVATVLRALVGPEAAQFIILDIFGN
jgi:hypothetical protein